MLGIVNKTVTYITLANDIKVHCHFYETPLLSSYIQASTFLLFDL